MNENIIQKTETLGSGKWLVLEKLSYRDKDGISRNWEAVTRTGPNEAIAVIATLKPSNRLLLIRQYRPPADGYVIEFPAGVIDDGESAEEAAARELLEETGYRGRIVDTTGPVYNTPGVSRETVQLVFMEIDEAENREITRNPEEGEDIESHAVPYEELQSFLHKSIEKGDRIDAKVMSFIRGLQFVFHSNPSDEGA